MNKLKIIFAGTPPFAGICLDALLGTAHEICAVFTQPDRPAGRGRRLTESIVKQLALQHHLPIYQPENLRTEEAQKIIQDLHADVMIVVAYGLILPSTLLAIPRLGCINVHASLLPRWRGAAPIQRAILAGDDTTGITIMQMDQGLDTGAILQQVSCPIQPMDSALQLEQRLADLGAKTLLDTLEKLQAGQITAIAQDNTQACYAAKIDKQEALLDWHDSALALDRRIRAFNPRPIAQTLLDTQMIRIWQATPIATTTSASPGTILDATSKGIDVATGEGVLRLLQLQLPGGKPLAIADILNAKRELFSTGKHFANGTLP